MKGLLTIIILSLPFASCDRKKVCSEAEQRTKGEVLAIRGPDSLAIGETVPILLEVEVNDSFCVKKAEGIIVGTVGTHVQVGANLVHTGYRIDNDCECTNEQTLKTVIYFTPNAAGNYVFSQTPPSPIVNLGDSTDFQIIVR